MKPQIHYGRKLLFLTTVFLSISFLSISQTIKGVVSDSVGKPLTGATVEIKGTSIRTSTNTEGVYSITGRKPLTTKDAIVVSFTGYQTTHVPFTGKTNINIELHSAQTVLNEVVVTALGIKRKEKSLGLPVSSRITGTGYNAHLAADNPVDFGSTVSDINPDDIEKITVLKGAGATTGGKELISLRSLSIR